MDLSRSLEDLALSTSLSQIQHTPAPKRAPPTFLTLPAGVRGKIYGYATTFPEIEEQAEVDEKLRRGLSAFGEAKFFITNCVRRPVLPLARLAAVNRQIRGEIKSIGLGAYKSRQLEGIAMYRELARVQHEVDTLAEYWLEVYKIM